MPSNVLRPDSLTYRIEFLNGDRRSGLTLDAAWALFWCYHLSSNPCSLHVERDAEEPPPSRGYVTAHFGATMPLPHCSI